jgi:hypothetical protein
LREAEKWDNSPVIGPQVFLGAPDNTDMSPALQKLAEVAKDSQPDKTPQWPTALKTELPRVLEAQKAHAGTLTGRELEAACVAAFIYSQPIGEQGELADLRWLLGPTCDLPAVLSNGLIAWAKTSWYLEAADATEPSTNVPKYWRLGPKPNLNQVHFTYKQKALSFAKGRFDELAKKCGPLKEGCDQEGIKFHNQPNLPADVEDDGVFRQIVLSADYAGQPGYPPESRAIPQVAVSEIHKTVAQAVKAGDLSLVFGNDSVWEEEPTVVQLDAMAKNYRRPGTLNAIELLPGTLKDAWSAEAEPRTTVETLYAELKKAKGNPWPPKSFINTLGEALGRGVVARVSGSGPLVSLATDGKLELAVKASAPPPPPPDAIPGRKLSARVSLSPAEFQNLPDDVATLTKSLAGCDVQFEVAVSVKTKSGMDLKAANEVLENIKEGWKL